MEPWQKGAPAVKKMTKGAQASYFKRFPDREDWFRKNHPDMAHFDTSVKQASKAKAVDKAALEKKSLKAYGATRGTATGGEGGNADAPPRDTIAPLTRDQHSAIQAAKKAAEPPKPEKKPAAPKKVDRMALIRAAAKKSQSAAAKEKRASQFDAPTFDPDDTDHDDYANAHYGMHQYTEEVELEEETIHVGYMNSKGEFIKTSTHNNSVDADKAFDELHKTKGKKARYNYDNGGSIDPGAMMSMHNRSPFGEEIELEEGKMKSAAADRDDDKGHEDFEATLSHAVKMAKGVAFDKRYKGGNMTGAVRAIRAIGKKYGMHGLEDHPEVNSALRRANEELEINEMDSEGYTGSRDDGDPNKGTGKGTPISRKAMTDTALKALDHAALDAKYGKPRPAPEKPTNNMSKSHAIGNDGKIYHFQDPRLKHKDYGNGVRGSKIRNEEVEQVDEVAKWRTNPKAHNVDTDGSYLSKTHDKIDPLKARAGYLSTAKDYIRKNIKNVRNARMQSQGFAKSAIKMFPQNEEVEYIEERLSKSDPASTWISHFVSSENPMFSGKTKKERINMALGAYYKAKRAAPKNEEVEIDESSHEGRTPESPEETELAKHHGNPNKITYGDVVKARIKSAKRKKSED